MIEHSCNSYIKEGGEEGLNLDDFKEVFRVVLGINNVEKLGINFSNKDFVETSTTHVSLFIV